MAEYHQVPAEVAKPVLGRLNQLAQIHRRLSAIGMGFGNRWVSKPKKPFQPGPPSLDQLVLESEHNIFIDPDSNQYFCTTCINSVSKTGKLRQFLTGKCVENSSSSAPIAIGAQITHPSHRLVLYGGVFLCKKCGSVAKQKMVKLSSPCGPPSTAGWRNRNAYYSNVKLPGYPNWPYKKCIIPYQHKNTRTDAFTISRIQKQVEALATSLATPRHLAEFTSEDLGVGLTAASRESTAPPSTFGSESGSD